MMHVCERLGLLSLGVLLLQGCTVKINVSQTAALSSEVAVPAVNVCAGLGDLVPFARGDGTAGSPYGICSKEQMDRVGSNSIYLDKYFILLADIDLSSFTANSFTLIGTAASPFVGTFDGNGKVISNFTYSSPGVNYIGLFRRIGTNGVVKNLGVESASITGGVYTGILAGETNGSIEGCHVQGSVIGSTRVGGLSGRFWGAYPASVIKDSYATGTVNGAEFVGGLIGWVRGTVKSSYTTGTVTATLRAGGLIGIVDRGAVENCYADKVVTATNIGIGGLIGAIGGKVLNSYSKGSVSGGDYVGGLVGWIDVDSSTGIGFIQNSYSLSSITGRDAVGGLTGYTYAPVPITDSYSRSTISARQWVGGLAGWADGTITNSYSASTSITASVGDLGGLTGGSSNTVTNSFWDIDTSGILISGHDNIFDGVGGTTTATMKTATTYTVPGWSAVIWDIVDGSYPIFK